MARRRIPDWPIYALLVGGLLWYAFTGRERQPAPEPPPPLSAEAPIDGEALPAASAFDPVVMVEAGQRPQTGFGTAFSVDRGGTWMTARHVVDGCTEVSIITDRGRGVRARGWVDPNADIAVIYTEGASAALPLAARSLRIGERAYHLGFPQGRPGEATSRLIGREQLNVLGRGAREEPVLAWAETGRTEGLQGTLGGLSGGPAVDANGRVVGVTVAEQPRRGRIYTTAPDTFYAAVEARVPERRGVAPVPAPTPDSYGRVGDALRRTLRVAPVVCLSVS